MRRPVDPMDGLGELAALWGATSADELHRVLVLRPVIRRSVDAHEPFGLLAKHHEIEPETSVVTAMLLLTDPRWRDGVPQLVRRIEDEAILDDEALDLLARTFISGDKALYWVLPDDWFGGAELSIDLGEEPAPVDQPTDDDDDDDDGPTVVRRELPPALRRWAAGRVVRRNPNSWGAVFGRARALDKRSAAAIMSGLLDEVDSIPAPARRLLIGAALDSPDHAVRRAGLELFAVTDGVDAAYARAISDPKRRSELGPKRSSDERLQRRPTSHRTVDRVERSERRGRTHRRCSDDRRSRHPVFPGRLFDRFRRMAVVPVGVADAHEFVTPEVEHQRRCRGTARPWPGSAAGMEGQERHRPDRAVDGGHQRFSATRDPRVHHLRASVRGP
ncbi:MAG: hypothetical protein ABIR32_06865 [Ilumatobacteraceae bacterium]